MRKTPGPMYQAVVALVALVGFGTMAVVLSPATEPPEGSFADRINAACSRPGYQMVDWTVGDEFDPLPAGVVMVTCESATFDRYTVAVQRDG